MLFSIILSKSNPSDCEQLRSIFNVDCFSLAQKKFIIISFLINSQRRTIFMYGVGDRTKQKRIHQKKRLSCVILPRSESDDYLLLFLAIRNRIEMILFDEYFHQDCCSSLE